MRDPTLTRNLLPWRQRVLHVPTLPRSSSPPRPGLHLPLGLASTQPRRSLCRWGPTRSRVLDARPGQEVRSPKTPSLRSRPLPGRDNTGWVPVHRLLGVRTRVLPEWSTGPPPLVSPWVKPTGPIQPWPTPLPPSRPSPAPPRTRNVLSLPSPPLTQTTDLPSHRGVPPHRRVPDPSSTLPEPPVLSPGPPTRRPVVTKDQLGLFIDHHCRHPGLSPLFSVSLVTRPDHPCTHPPLVRTQPPRLRLSPRRS